MGNLKPSRMTEKLEYVYRMLVVKFSLFELTSNPLLYFCLLDVQIFDN